MKSTPSGDLGITTAGSSRLWDACPNGSILLPAMCTCGRFMRLFRQFILAATLSLSSLCMGPAHSAFAHDVEDLDSKGSGNSFEAEVIVRKVGSKNFFRSKINTNQVTGEYSVATPLGALEPGSYTVTVLHVKGRIETNLPQPRPEPRRSFVRITKKHVQACPASFVVGNGAGVPEIKLTHPIPMLPEARGR